VLHPCPNVLHETLLLKLRSGHRCAAQIRDSLAQGVGRWARPQSSAGRTLGDPGDSLPRHREPWTQRAWLPSSAHAVQEV